MIYLDINLYFNNTYYKNNPILFKLLVELINKTTTGFSKALRSKGKSHGQIYNELLDRTELLNWINNSVPLLSDSKYTLSTKCYWILNDISDFPKCTNKKCKNYNTSNGFIGKNVSLRKGYSKYCDRKCQNSSSIVLLKQLLTCIKNYGVTSPLQSQIIKNKVKQTLYSLYGVTNVALIQSKNKQNLKKSYYEFICKNKYDIPMFTIDEYLKRQDNNQVFKFKCLKCGNIFESRHKNGYHYKCPICYPINLGYSILEKEILDFIKSIYNNKILENNTLIIHPLELDIYIPNIKLAIEFDGLYWHSDHIKNSKYHLTKTNLCETKGILLIHIFENEWRYKQDIVKSRLKNLLGIYDKTVFARKCEVKEVSSKESFDFQEANHIQGAVNSKISIGLYFQDELISLMTFSKPRFDKRHEWELVRFCNKLGYHIPGGASKLLKHFERTYSPKSIVSYADRRWSRGKLYEALGFKLDHISRPDYWYWLDSMNIFNRILCLKHKLKTFLKIFDNNLTEYENMKINGYHRIYDCGNLVFEKSK